MVIFDADDFAQSQQENALNWFVAFKHKYPKFKVTLFTILGRWNIEILKKIKESFEWIELAAHGWEHLTNDEAFKWNKQRWYHVLNAYEKTGIFTKTFKAPNWEMSSLGYHCLKDMGWSVAIRNHQLNDVPQGMKYYDFEANPFAVHCHTWTMPAHEKEGIFNNWSESTDFQFVSENLEQKL